MGFASGVQRIEDPHHARGYRDLRSPAEMRKLLNRKVTEQGGKCAICHKEFAEYSDIVPDHKHPKGMEEAAWRDDHPDNIQAFKPHIGGATLKRDRAGLTTDDPMTSGHSTSEPHECWIEQGAVRNACGEMLRQRTTSIPTASLMDFCAAGKETTPRLAFRVQGLAPARAHFLTA